MPEISTKKGLDSFPMFEKMNFAVCIYDHLIASHLLSHKDCASPDYSPRFIL